MFRIGLTGGIGSGKSTVAKIFEVLGIPVYYADEEARKLMNEDENIRQQVIKHFGLESYSDGKLNRKHISSLVFNDKEKLALLNSITHPAVIHHGEQWMKKQKAHYALHEAALIFESGSAKNMDHVIGVSAPEQLRIERTMQRDHIQKEQVIARMKNQMNENEKMEKCDFVIYNDEQQLMMPQVLEIHKKLSGLGLGGR